MSVLQDKQVREAMRLAWEDSQPGAPSAHEEGGFVLLNPDGSLSVERWPGGSQKRIVVPAFFGGKRNGLVIAATFHTHPNSGATFIQEPSPVDIEAVQNDANLGHPEYEGEFVISRGHVYRIPHDGSVEVVGDPTSLLGLIGG